MLHELKCWPEFFQAILDDRMRFNLRRDDRDFRVGDRLLLKEWDPAAYERLLSLEHEPVPEEVLQQFVEVAYTGRELLVRVDYIMPGVVMNELQGRRLGDGDFVIMSISKI
jgi:hypothetical protein